MIDLFLKRRSIRKFKEQPVEEDKIKALLTAALAAPTSKNKRSWEFVVIESKETLKTLSIAKPMGGSFLANAPLAIAVLGDTEASPVWVEDASIACAHIMLQAEAMDLGCTWVQVRGRNHESGIPASDFIKEKLNAPKDHEVLAVMGIGYKDEEKRARVEEVLKWEKVHRETY